MKATKIFMMAALALTFAACSNNDDDFAKQPTEQPANGEITITAILDANDGASTRALGIDGDNIASTWKTTDQFAILYNNGTDNTKSIATVEKIDGTTVTITFTIPASLADNTACTIVYPASAANAANTGADVATALATQDGTIGNCPEVRVGTATIDKDNHSLSNVTKLAARNAIFKFTLQDLSAAAKNATEFKVSANSGYVITTVTPGSASNVLYVALPAMGYGIYWFNATIDNKPYIAKATMAAATVAGKYYQTTVKMATIGDVILSDGKFAARTSTTGTKVAMIAYLGSETGDATYTHGLALALSDEATKMKWTTATGASGAAAHTPAAPTPMTSSWMLPSKEDQWKKMIDACRNVLGTNNNYKDLRDGFSGISGASNLQSGNYWSRSEDGSDNAWHYDFDWGIWCSISKGYGDARVRACLAF